MTAVSGAVTSGGCQAGGSATGAENSCKSTGISTSTGPEKPLVAMRCASKIVGTTSSWLCTRKAALVKPRAISNWSTPCSL